jgi:hypothetical protein
MVWNGTAESGVDLHPTNLGALTESEARGVGGGQQVGYVIGPATDNRTHAVLWQGSPDSAIDLHPTHLAEFNSSVAGAANGSIQVGSAAASLEYAHAMLWVGTPETALDLHNLLPTGFKSSGASSIDPAGRIYGIATAINGQRHAVMWVPAPEPATIALAIACLSFTGILR